MTQQPTISKIKDSSHEFRIRNLSINELEKHVRARQAVISNVDLVKWNFGEEGLDTFNKAFWQTTIQVQQGITPSQAIDDLFSQNASKYTYGCNFTSGFIILKGTKDIVGDKLFNTIGMETPGSPLSIFDQAKYTGLLKKHLVTPGKATPTLKDWVPGDRGYIEGAGTGLNQGEWIIYLGGDQFYGFMNKPKKLTLSEWVSEVKGFSEGVAEEDGQRWYPGVGLE